MDTIDRPSIEPHDELSAWARGLETIASQPIEFCEEFPRIASRFEAWWNHDAIDRPLFLGAANRNLGRPITRRLDLLSDPTAWLDAKLEDLRQVHRVGDKLPYIRTDFGPVFLGAMLGGTLEFGSDTAWTQAFIHDDWSNTPDWHLDSSNPWWKSLRELTALAAQDGAGRYLVCTPDLGASADVLLNLRGSSALCLDAITQPGVLKDAIDAIYPAWHEAFTTLYRIALGHGAGLIHWLEIWSNRPYLVPACDFNFLIGPEQFNAICLPDIARQSATVGRAVFHLDGPGAARHIDALLEVPDIQAIQFTPGEGSPSALAWVPMFKKIQSRGKSLYVFCPADEVLELSAALKPEGLAIVPGGGLTPEKLDALFETFCKEL
jgi:hypothetical protein